ncbi:Carbon-nitrogen hydrolase [Perkinsus olseni]|uniref:Carbon-nitrogen hydrolase n=1 Tax=Perkinsus olseni TaxID=32597 RepID=A0A7J6PE18_PEROL|nr:Carbon-nitrogen hydrolase [Perkinsus olseni]
MSAASPALKSSLRVALLQTRVLPDKASSLRGARETLLAAIEMSKPDLCVLGEMFTCPYHPKYFRQFGERIHNSPTLDMVKEVAKEKRVWIIGGTIPELEGDKVYNTALVVNDSGELVKTHRKAHLFDIDVPADGDKPGIRFFESETLSPGNTGPCVFDTPWGPFGLGICYDVRFPEYAALLRNVAPDLKMLIYPGAFNMTTGPAHWRLLARARALDSQCYVVMASPSRSENPEDYQAWGHSMVVNPWGEVVDETDEKHGWFTVDVDLTMVDKVRRNIPTATQKRYDLYTKVMPVEQRNEEN